MNRPNGGAAFPGVYYGEIPDVTFDGMSLRDYFAAQTIAVLADRDAHAVLDVHGVARRAYDLADAMLAERER